MLASNPQELHRCFAQAFNAGDLAGLLALYEAAAVLVPEPGQNVAGIDAVRGALQQFLDLKGSIEMETIYCVESGNTALLRGKWRLHGKAPDGNPIDMAGNSIEVVQRQSDGTWRFTIDHPFGAE